MSRKHLVLACIVLGISQGGAAQAQDFDQFLDPSLWRARASIGVDLSPNYLGSGEYDFTIQPGIDMLWNDLVFIRTIGGIFQKQGDGIQVGANFLPTDRLQVDAGFQLARGRSVSDSSGELAGTTDKDASPELFASAEYAWSYFRIDASLHQGVIGGHAGTTISGGFSVGARFRPDLDGWARAGLGWGSTSYTDFFFSAPGYAASSGFNSLDLGVGATYRLDEQLALKASLDYRALLSSAGDSPITKSRHQFTLNSYIQYDF